MAEQLDSGVHIDIEDLEKTINCPICFEYMLDSRTLYPCVHTFCAKCVSRLDKMQQDGKPGVECPICRGFVPESEIRTNRLMNILINLVTEEGSEDSFDLGPTVGGSTCVQCDSPLVTSKCLTCSIDLCQKCQHGHLRIPGFQEHNVTPNKPGVKRQTSDVIIQCTKHPDHEINANCKTCNFAICSQCQITEHTHHQIETLQVALKRYRLTIKSAMTIISKKSDAKKKRLVEIEEKRKLLQENEAAVQLKLDEHTEKVQLEIKKLEERITNGYDDMTSLLKANIDSQVRELDSRQKNLEMSLISDENVKVWVEAIAAKTDGGGLLAELQSGLFNKIHEIQNQPLPEAISCKLYSFNPHPNVIDILQKIKPGEIAFKDASPKKRYIPHGASTATAAASSPRTPQSFQRFPTAPSAPSVPNMATAPSQIQLEHDEFYDIISAAMTLSDTKGDLRIHQHEDFTNMSTDTLIAEIPIRNHCYRMCVFQYKVWIPCTRDCCIKVYSPLEGTSVRTIALHHITYPYSLQVYNKEMMIMASHSGLHLLDSNGGIRHRLHGDKFNDVYVHGDMVIGLLQKEVVIWSNNFKNSLSFKVSLGMGVSTLHIQEPYIYICECLCHVVHKFSFRGQYIETFGQTGVPKGELSNTYICGSDEGGNLLIANHKNLKVLSHTGEWYTLYIEVNKPCDAVVLGDLLFVLQNGEDDQRKLSMYKM